MFRIKSISLLILAATFLAACQLFEPLPTLPPVLTLEPLATEASSGVSQPEQIPETAAIATAIPAIATIPASASSEPSATLPVSTATTAPTQAQVAAPSATSRPTKIPAPTAAATSSWHDVPIMPGASEGAEEDGAYSYIVSSSVSEVQEYYDQFMPLSGWAPFASGEGEAGNLLLMFQKGNLTATIGIIKDAAGTMVLIVAE